MNSTRTLKTSLLSALLFLFFVILASKAHIAQENSYHIQRGERPPIDLHSLDPDSYEPGVILIKFNQQYEATLEQHPAHITENGKVRFNIASVDQLNDIRGAIDFKQEFLHPALNNSFTEKHKAWGFHLWYRLEFDTRADILAIVRDYQSLSEILIAEPEYRKTLIEGLGFEPYEIPESNAPGNISLNWTPNDPSFNNQWHYYNTGQSNGTPGADISLLAAWDIEKGHPDVIVAIVDDGIQFNHPDLAGNMWAGTGYNFVNNSSNVNPGNHGTHVAGTVAAVSNNGLGVAGVAGGDGSGNGVRLMSAQVFMGSSSGGFHVAPVWAADNGAAISQNSWGYTSPNVYNQNVLDAIDYFNINGGGDALLGGGITIFAAGNSNSSAPYYPGYYSGAFAVAGTNNQDQKSWYSNFGSWIDISAPGGETNSVTSRGVLSTVTNSSYAYYQGTSMACPHVSGVAALVLSHVYGQLTPEELKTILINSTDDHYVVNPNFIGQLGSGRLNAHQALIEAQDYASAVPNPASFSASTFGPTEIMLSWAPNMNANEVLIAWSTSESFGSPDSGMFYQPGVIIPGGGLVIYTGSGTSFIHSNLEPASLYHYKIWSFDSLNQYSSGRYEWALTACEVLNTPIFEGFETNADLPFCWSQEYVNQAIDWEIAAGNDGSNPQNSFEGSFNALFKAQGSDEAGAVTRLMMPLVNLASYENAELSFAFTNETRTVGSSNYQDVLRVKYKPSINANWQTLAVFDSNAINWTEVVMAIPVSSSTSFIAFEAESGRGHGICIDNVAIVGYGNVPTYEITASSGPNGTITPLGTVVVGQGGDFTYSIQAANNYSIDSLLVDGQYIEEANGEASYTYQFVNINGNRTIHSTFSVATYNVQASVMPVNSGIVEGVGNYPFNSQVSLLAIPENGFEFSRWLEGGSTISYANPFEFITTGNRNLIALFTPIIYSVQAIADPPEAGSVSGNGSFTYGAQVTLTAQPNTGYIFVEWLENGEVISNNNPLIFNVEESRTLIAGFELGTGISSAHNEYFTVFPNPSSHLFNITIAETSAYQLLDLTGRVVSVGSFEPGLSQLNLSSSPKGLYFLRLFNQNGTFVVKLIKE